MFEDLNLSGFLSTIFIFNSNFNDKYLEISNTSPKTLISINLIFKMIVYWDRGMLTLDQNIGNFPSKIMKNPPIKEVIDFSSKWESYSRCMIFDIILYIFQLES